MAFSMFLIFTSQVIALDIDVVNQALCIELSPCDIATNLIEEVEEINMFEKAIVGGLKAARAITGKGIIYTVKCRPFYVNLLS